MPRSSIDKSFAAAPVSPAFNQPNSADFLPKYEETLNHNLRNSGDPEAQYGPVDRRIQEPDLKYGLTKKRRAIVVGSLIALVIIIGAVLAGLLTAKISSAKQQVSTSSNATITTIVTKPTLQTPLSTRATMLQPQGTTTALAESKSHPTKTAAATPSVISLTTLITTTVAGPSSKLFTSFLTAKPQTTQASDSLPLVVSTTAFWTKTAPDASFEIYTSRTTIFGKSQSTFFSYSPTSTPTSTSTSSVLTANKSIIASVLSSLQAQATPSPNTSSQAPAPAPPLPTTVSTTLTATPVVASVETVSGGENWIGYCGVRGSACY
ncbi:hypothetical protein LTR56_017471 [Elasticomyces elasticus]|nr:hypothetical protein LTR56_017471 [Elasticomyces elasticus]KAK3640884.1 hypothetical protein LTR22_016806 [Elasticomyces elasticus]KAK5759073.1 hypothetical protein LTS12_010845 [Elasticomyces elasticus]